jgi:hypothetical protein
MSEAGRGAGEGAGADPEIRALAERWPRALIELGLAAPLAARWTASRRAASAGGRPALARHPLTPALGAVLFEARRSRRLVRGLEASEEALEAQRRGVRSARSAAGEAPGSTPQRISRLLLVSEDGANRFYRNIDALLRKYGAMLEVLVLACDEEALGSVAFGPGQRARALLVEHKEAVIRVLETLDQLEGAGEAERPVAG